MLLSKEFLNKVNPNNFIGTTNNDVATSLTNRNRFTEIVSGCNFSTEQDVEDYINILKDADEIELTGLAKILNQKVKPDSLKSMFIYAQMINTFIEALDSFTSEQFYYVLAAFKSIDVAHSQLHFTDDNIFISTTALLKKIGTKLMSIKQYFEKGKDIDESEIKFLTQYEINKLNEDYKSICENSLITVDIEAGADGLDVKPRTEIDELIAWFKNLEYRNANVADDRDNDFIISKIDQLPAYVRLIYGRSQQGYADELIAPIWFINQYLQVMRTNRRGLEKLYEIICKIERDLDSIAYQSFECRDAAYSFKEYLEDVKYQILLDEEDIDKSAVEPEVNPIIEMGLGYFYDIMPVDTSNLDEAAWDNILNELNEASIDVNALGLLSESISILNEKISNPVEDELELIKQKRIDKYEAKKKRKEEKEARKTAIKQRKEDRKIQQKEEDEDRKIAAKRELADRKQQIKTDRKVQKYQDRLNARDTRKAMLAEKLRALPLTNDGFNRAKTALNRAIGAAVGAGGAALIGLNPIVGAALYLIPKYLNQRSGSTAKSHERSVAISSINANIERLEAKIADAESRGNTQLAGQLSQLKSKLQSTANRIGANAGAKGGGIVE